MALREPLQAVNGKSSIEMAAEKERRDELLRQSSLLLTDKCLRRGIRKARIAGRSLQILFGPKGIIEEERRKTEQAELGEDFATDNDSDIDTDGDVDLNNNREKSLTTVWSAFDNLTRNSFDDEELNDVIFDVDFFEGANFFRNMNENQK